MARIGNIPSYNNMIFSQIVPTPVGQRRVLRVSAPQN
jgi:hypothetical protein